MMITSENMSEFQAPTWKPPPKLRTLDALEQVYACYPCADFNTKIVTPFVEVYADEWLELHCCADVRTRRLEIARKPPGSKAQLSNWRLKPDLPGLYVLRLVLVDVWFREIGVAVFPRAAEQRLQMADPKRSRDRRMRLREICRDKRVTAATVIDSLEGDDPTHGLGGRIVGGGRPLPPGASVDGASSVAFSVTNYYVQG